MLTNDKAPEDCGKIKLIDARELGTKMRKSLGDKRKELTPEAIDDIVRLYGDASHPDFEGDVKVKVLPRETFGFQRITVERPLRRRWEVGAAAGSLILGGGQFADFIVLMGSRYDTQRALEADMANLPAISSSAKRKFIAACAVSDPEAPVITGRGGQPEPDPELRDQENVPLPAGWLALGEHEREKALIETAEAHLETEIRPYVPDAWIDHSKTKLGFEIPFTRQFYVYTPPRPVAEIAAEIKELESQIQSWMTGLGL